MVDFTAELRVALNITEFSLDMFKVWGFENKLQLLSKLIKAFSLW